MCVLFYIYYSYWRVSTGSVLDANQAFIVVMVNAMAMAIMAAHRNITQFKEVL